MKLNAGMSKLMVFERNLVTSCKISVSEQELERVEDFTYQYLGSKLSKDDNLGSFVRESEGLQNCWDLIAITTNRNVRMEVMMT